MAAETWGVPPWEVTGEARPNRLLWFLRWRAYSEEVSRAGRDGKKHGKGKH